MVSKAEYQIKELEFRILKLRHTLEVLLPLWGVIDRKVMYLKAQLENLEKQKADRDQGQLNFDVPF